MEPEPEQAMDAEDAEVDEAQGLVDDLLKVAVKSFTVKTVDKLIEKHVANHHQVSAEGHTLLHEAAQHQSPQQAFEICKLLVKKHNLKATAMDNRKQTAVFFAAKCGNVQLCEYLLQEGCEVDHVDIAQQTPLFYAARFGHVGAADVLLEKGAKVDFKDLRGFTPIFWAAEGAKVEMMKHLVDKGANTKLLSIYGGDIFTSASGAAVDYAVDELGADPRRSLIKKQNNLFLAAKHGNLEKLQVCIQKYGLDVNHVDENGQTCLFYAAFQGGQLVTQILLNQYKANALIADVQGRTALKYIVSKGNSKDRKDARECEKLLSEAEKKQQKALEAAEKKRRAAALREQKKRENEEKKRRQRQQQLEQQEKRRRQAEEKARLDRQKAEERLRDEQRREARTSAAASSSKRARSPEQESSEKRRRFELKFTNKRGKVVDRNSKEYRDRLGELMQALPFLKKKQRSSRRNA